MDTRVRTQPDTARMRRTPALTASSRTIALESAAARLRTAETWGRRRGLDLEMDGGGTGFLLGSALPQTSSTLAASQGYGMNLTGVNTVEEDDIAEFTTTSSGFSGLIKSAASYRSQQSLP
jgi:hypothetical protein